ncbi:MAG: SPOR domain-containing protein [Nitrospirota bacterium]
MADAHAKSRVGSKRTAGSPSLKPYLAIVALLVVIGVASFSLVERWLAEPTADAPSEDAGMTGGGRVVIGSKSASTASKPPANGATSAEAPYKPQEFTFYKSLGTTTESEPKLEPPPASVPPPRATPSAKTADRKGTATRKAYTVQVGSFQDRKSAERLATKVRRYQYTVSVNRVVLPDSGVRYRVRVGSFATRDDALKVADILKKKERVEPFVALVAPSAG